MILMLAKCSSISILPPPSPRRGMSYIARKKDIVMLDEQVDLAANREEKKSEI